MFAIGLPELLIAFVLSLVVLLAVAYWIVRLAVRHGTTDAQQRQTAHDGRPGAPE